MPSPLLIDEYQLLRQRRFGRALNLHHHVHSLLPDGLFVETSEERLAFVPLPAPPMPPATDIGMPESKLVGDRRPQSGDASPTVRRRTPMPWARLLHRVFSINALRCPHCSEAMVILAPLRPTRRHADPSPPTFPNRAATAAAPAVSTPMADQRIWWGWENYVPGAGNRGMTGGSGAGRSLTPVERWPKGPPTVWTRVAMMAG